MFKRITGALLCAALTLTAFAGCSLSPATVTSQESSVKDWPATVNGVTLKSEPTGVAVVSPNLADVVLSLGYDVKLKAKSKDCTQQALATLTNVTVNDVQTIKSKGVSLVLTDAKPTEAQQSALDNAGVQVIAIPAVQSRAKLQTLYTTVGTAMKGAETGAQCGKKAAQSALMTIDSVTRLVPKSKTVTTGVYLYDAAGGAATGDTMAGSLLTAAGITNVAGGSKNSKMDITALKTVNPSLIFCPKGLKSTLSKTEGYKDLQAVQSGKVYEMDPLLMKTEGENMITAVTYMAGIAYPSLLKTNSAADGAASSASSDSVIPNSTIPAGTTLQSGDQGDNVKAMQNRLKELGYLFVNPTGLYGDGTVQSVQDFQLYNNLDTTGIADSKTLTKMFSKDAAVSPESNSGSTDDSGDTDNAG